MTRVGRTPHTKKTPDDGIGSRRDKQRLLTKARRLAQAIDTRAAKLLSGIDNLGTLVAIGRKVATKGRL